MRAKDNFERVGVSGFLIVILAAACMDSDPIYIPAAGLLIGCLLMGGSVWSASRK